MKNRGSLLKTLTGFDRHLKRCSASIESDFTWTLNSHDAAEMVQTARRIARVQLTMMKLSRQLVRVSRQIRASVAGKSGCVAMPVRSKLSNLSSGKNETCRQRSAFAAVSTQNGAFVARVLEDTSGVWPQKEYSRFETWTQAQCFANMLNQKYGIDVIEAQHIVVSARLAAATSRGPES